MYKVICGAIDNYKDHLLIIWGIYNKPYYSPHTYTSYTEGTPSYMLTFFWPLILILLMILLIANVISGLTEIKSPLHQVEVAN